MSTPADRAMGVLNLGNAPRDRLRLRRSRIRAARHQPSHDALLGCPALADVRPAPGLLELVVVPTCRPFAQTHESIRYALELAAPFGALVLVLCSRDARPAAFLRHLVGNSSRAAVVDFGMAQANGHLLDVLPTLKTTGHTLAPADAWDTADKRNFALLFAAARGLTRVLFLDDDVSPAAPADGPTLNPASLAAAMTLLRDDVIDGGGWTLSDFPDNSVVCHARRLAGLRQGVFVGAAALTLQVGRSTTFFPSIYNEDWLQQFPILVRPGEPPRFATLGRVRQARYNPYRKHRARHEEYGDLIAEGLYQLLQRGEPVEEHWQSPAFWHEVIQSRRAMIGEIKARLRVSAALARFAVELKRVGRWVRGQVPEDMKRRLPAWVSSTAHRVLDTVTLAHSTRPRQAAIAALNASLTKHGATRGGAELADAICEWIGAWQEDLGRWRGRLADPPGAAIARIVDDPRLTTWIGPRSAAARVDLSEVEVDADQAVADS